MRVVCLSDTHNRHADLAVPHGDVLVHAGDLTLKGTLPEVGAGFAWLAALPHERILFVPGNHDFAFEREAGLVADLTARFPRVEIVFERTVDVGGLPLYASPYQPWFHDWAFNFKRGPEGLVEARETWSRIPGDTSILVTHGPAYGVNDLVWDGSHAGCPELATRMRALPKLQLFVCGHIHEAYGAERVGDVLHVNAATCTLNYRATQRPIVVDVAAGRAAIVEPASLRDDV